MSGTYDINATDNMVSVALHTNTMETMLSVAFHTTSHQRNRKHGFRCSYLILSYLLHFTQHRTDTIENMVSVALHTNATETMLSVAFCTTSHQRSRKHGFRCICIKSNGNHIIISRKQSISE